MLENDGMSSMGLSELYDTIVGNFAGSSEPDDSAPETVDTGTPPVAPSPDVAALPPDTTSPAERPVDLPVPAATDAPVVDDPFKDATPFSYTVDGQSRTFEGIKVLGKDGAWVEPDALERLQRQLGERDHLYERSQSEYRTRQQLDAVTSWTVKDAQGHDRTLTGTEGAIELRVAYGKALAENEALVKALTDPAVFQSIVSYQRQADGTVVAAPKMVELRNLLTQVELSEMRTEQSIRSHFTQALQQMSQPQQGTPDVASAAPAIIQQAAGNAIASLTAQDRQFLKAQMATYVRATTPAERQQLRGQTHIVDAAFETLVKDRIAMRAEMARTATTAADAAKQNAARIAAARGGKPPATARPTAPTQPPVRAQRAQNADAVFSMAERAASGLSLTP